VFALRHSIAFAFVLGILISACGTAATPASSPSASPKPQDAVGFVSTKLSEGPLDALPTLPLFINVLDVPQPPASPITHAHIAGFVYGVTGIHQLTITGSAAKDVKPGEAAFVPTNVGHTHANPGTTPSQWYFMGLRNTGARAGTPLFPGQATLFESPDLPATALPAGKYLEQLNVTTLEKGGRTAAHKHGGVEVFVILDGTVTLKVAGQQPQTLAKGKGAIVLPDTTLQVTNAGDGQAKWLAYFVTLDSAPFSTNVDTLP
jgi:quercetin dioxygenase-like cupin family protein